MQPTNLCILPEPKHTHVITFPWETCRSTAEHKTTSSTAQAGSARVMASMGFKLLPPRRRTLPDGDFDTRQDCTRHGEQGAGSATLQVVVLSGAHAGSQSPNPSSCSLYAQYNYVLSLLLLLCCQKPKDSYVGPHACMLKHLLAYCYGAGLCCDT